MILQRPNHLGSKGEILTSLNRRSWSQRPYSRFSKLLRAAKIGPGYFIAGRKSRDRIRELEWIMMLSKGLLVQMERRETT